jgi:hypothetical protein
MFCLVYTAEAEYFTLASCSESPEYEEDFLYDLHIRVYDTLYTSDM